MPRMVIKIAMKRKVGQDHPEAARQRPDHWSPLPMGETERMQQHDPGTGAGLAVGHPRPVAVVIEAQAHSWIVSLPCHNRPPNGPSFFFKQKTAYEVRT